MSATKIIYTYVCIFFLIFTSCDNQKIADSYQPIPKNGWPINFPIQFEYNIFENSCQMDFLIGLRNNGEYRYSNIFFFVDLIFPDGSSGTDTVQFLLAEPNGRWLGNGVGPIKHSLLIFKENQEIQQGIYKFNISHGMRDSVLLGIEDIGVRIEKSY